MGESLNPSYWNMYVKHRHHLGESVEKGIAIFFGRYRLAKAFSGLNAGGISEATRAGYDAVMHVALAYTAMEALENAIGTSRSHALRHPVISLTFSEAIRAGLFDDLLRQIELAADKDSRREQYRKEFAEIKSGPEDVNLRPIVYGVRNVVFHGSFTPSTAALNSGTRKLRLLTELSIEVLASANDQFTSWVKVQKSPQV